MQERAGCFTVLVFLMVVTVTVMWLFLTVPWAGLQCVFVVFPDHTHLLLVQLGLCVKAFFMDWILQFAL